DVHRQRVRFVIMSSSVLPAVAPNANTIPCAKICRWFEFKALTDQAPSRWFLDETDLDVAGSADSRNGLFVAGGRPGRRVAPQREVHDLLVWRRRERATFPGLLCARGWLLQSVSAGRQSSWRRKIFL